MGKIISSENSLNQHIKNKHAELWETIKAKHEQAMENALRNESIEASDKLNTEHIPTKKMSFDEMPVKFDSQEQ